MNLYAAGDIRLDAMTERFRCRGVRLCLLILFLNLGCDPGVRYTPKGWVQNGHRRWVYQNEHLRALLVARPGGLVMSKSLIPEPEIQNLATQPLLFERVTITAEGRTYVGQFGSGNRVDVRTVNVGETKRMPMFFMFDDPMPQAFGKRFRMIVAYRVGNGDLKELTLDFSR